MEDNAYNRQVSKEILDMNKKYIKHLGKVGRGGISGGMCSCGGAMSAGAMSAGAMSAGRKPVRRVKGGVLDDSMVGDMEGGSFGSFMKGLVEAPLHLLGVGRPVGGAISRPIGGAKRGRKGRKKGGADKEENVYELPPPLTTAQRKSYVSVPIHEGAYDDLGEVAPIIDRSKKPLPRASMSGIKPAVLRAAKPKPKEGKGIFDLLAAPAKLLSAVAGAKPKRKAGAISAAAKPKKSTSPWIAHVKAFAAKHGISYRDALRSPKCKEEYRK